jgi:hypothetical protein
MSRLTDGLRIIRRRRAMNKHILIAAALAVASAAPARAADRPIEIGGGVGTVGSWFTSQPFSGGDLRVSFPVGPRGHVETIAALSTPGEERSGLYGVQYKQRLPTIGAAGIEPFFTAGAIGVFYRDRSDSTLTAPVLNVAGIGFDKRVAARLALRVDAQGIFALIIPAGVRVAAGVSVAVGRLPPAR